MASSISGLSFDPPRRLRESTQTEMPRASSASRSSLMKVSSLLVWEMKT